MNLPTKCILIILFPLVFTLIILVGIGCGKKSEEDKTTASDLFVPIENDIQTLDPAQLSDPFTSRIVWQIYEGLVGLDLQGVPIPLLAESWQASTDYRTWTFNLRPNVLFHESDYFGPNRRTRTVTSEDVRYSYLRFAKGFGSFVFSGLVDGLEDFLSGHSQTVSGFVASNESQFTIRLTRPDPVFIFRITSPYLSIMAKEVVEGDPNAFGRTSAIGTGPFRMTSRTDTKVVLEANPNYWRSTDGNLRRLVFRVDKNTQIRVAQFEKGGYGIMSLPVAVQSRFMDQGQLLPKWTSQYHSYKAETFNVHYLGMDNRRVTDIHLRRAIAFAVNKKVIVRDLLGGLASAANDLIPPGLQGFHAPSPLKFDPAAARLALAQSSYKGEQLSLLVSDIPNHEVIGQLLQSQLKLVGIQVELQRVDFNTLISRLFSADRPDLFLAFSEWVFSAPELIIESYRSTHFPNPNVTGYSNAEVDKLIDQALIATDRSDINQRCGQVSALVATEAPLVPLYHLDSIFLIKKQYSHFSVNGHQYWNFTEVRNEEN